MWRLITICRLKIKLFIPCCLKNTFQVRVWISDKVIFKSRKSLDNWWQVLIQCHLLWEKCHVYLQLSISIVCQKTEIHKQIAKNLRCSLNFGNEPELSNFPKRLSNEKRKLLLWYQISICFWHFTKNNKIWLNFLENL